jgi:glycine cleavage system transcriptional repressor
MASESPLTGHAILTATGEDRPGLVEEISEFIFDRGGSIQESRMANLAGQFAIIALVTGGEGALERIRGELPALEAQAAIEARLEPVVPRATVTAPRSTYRIEGRALDQPGLVHEVADVLRGFHVNIETLETNVVPAPVTGAPLFEMALVVSVPADVSVADLRAGLERVCEPLNIEWALDSVDDVPLTRRAR